MGRSFSVASNGTCALLCSPASAFSIWGLPHSAAIESLYGDDGAIAAAGNGGIQCRMVLFSAGTGHDYAEVGGRPSIQAMTSDSRQATARLPSWTGRGKSPSFNFRYTVDLLRPVSARTSGSFSRRWPFMVCSSWICLGTSSTIPARQSGISPWRRWRRLPGRRCSLRQVRKIRITEFVIPKRGPRKIKRCFP